MDARLQSIYTLPANDLLILYLQYSQNDILKWHPLTGTSSQEDPKLEEGVRVTNVIKWLSDKRDNKRTFNETCHTSPGHPVLDFSGGIPSELV